MKKTISYFFPFVKKYQSRYSGTVEVTWQKGNKVLNSKNANYSYGALERIMDFGLSHTPADRSAEVLVLGLGGGSVVALLRKKFHYYGKITAVEIDPALIKIAEDEFQIRKYNPLELVCGDALEYINKTESKFGLIIIDLFIDLKIPGQFFSTEFWKDLPQLLIPNGRIIFNAGIGSANQDEINFLQEEMANNIKFKRFDNVHGKNTLLLGKKSL